MVLSFLEVNFEYIITLSIVIFTLLVIFSIFDLKFDFGDNSNGRYLPDHIMKIESFLNQFKELPNSNEFEVDFCNKY